MSLLGAGVVLAAPLVAAGVGGAGAGVAVAVAGVAAAPVFPLVPPFRAEDIEGLSFAGIPAVVVGAPALPGSLVGANIAPSSKSLNSDFAVRECVSECMNPATMLAFCTPDPDVPFPGTWLSGTTTINARKLKDVVFEQANRPAIIMLPSTIAVIEFQRVELPFARDRTLSWGHQAHLSHHVLAVQFNSEGKIMFTYLSFLEPNVSMWVPGSGDYLQSSLAGIRGHQWEIPLSGNEGILFLKPSTNVTSTFEAFATANIPALSKAFPSVEGIPDSKTHLNYEGRYHIDWKVSSDAPSRIQQAYWSFLLRCFTTGAWRQLLVDQNTVGLKDAEALWDKLKALGKKSESELRPYLTYLQGFSSSSIMRFIISQDNAASFRERFFKGEWDDYNMNLLCVLHFLPMGTVWNCKDHTQDLMNGLVNLEMEMVRVCGEQWRDVFSPVASRIGIEELFVKHVPVHVMFFIIHLTLSQGFFHMKSEERVFNWQSDGIHTAPKYFRQLFNLKLSVEEVKTVVQDFDWSISGLVVWPFGSSKVIGGVDGLRSEPVIGPNLFPGAAIKRKAAALTDSIVSGPAGPVVPAVVPLGGGPPPLKSNPKQYCFQSLVSAFDLTLPSECPPCADPSSTVRCSKGLHLSKSNLPSVSMIVDRLEGIKGKTARNIVTLLKAKTDA